MAKKEPKIYKANPGFQEQFISSNVDFVVGGGVLNCGKTFAAVLSVAEPSSDSRFRACFLRNNLGDIKAGGGLVSEFKSVYGAHINAVESGDPHIDFPSGARIDLTHISDQTRDVIERRFKGRQYDLIYFDEGTGFTWECFTTVCSRNRGSADWTGKIRMTTNPKKNHWLRKFLDWYIDEKGFIDERRNGVIRYFYVNGNRVEDVVWGNSKEEVYARCKYSIDSALDKINGKTGKSTYEDMIKSFTFYLGRMSENVQSLGNNKGYVGSVAMMGSKKAQADLEGNWNVDLEEEEDAPIPSTVARSVFDNDPQTNGDKWITCDLADKGTDNCVILAWNGFHLIDVRIISRSRCVENPKYILDLAREHMIGENHIIFDETGAYYMRDYLPEAIGFISQKRPIGIDAFMAENLKTECYYRLTKMLKRGNISIDKNDDEGFDKEESDKSVANRRYFHAKMKDSITIETEFIEECSVVRFKETGNGRKKLMNKKEMNAKLGKGRSMDLLDPIAMRMYPILDVPHGEELVRTAYDREEEERNIYNNQSIYDESMYC